jgi:hypothetical protein
LIVETIADALPIDLLALFVSLFVAAGGGGEVFTFKKFSGFCDICYKVNKEIVFKWDNHTQPHTTTNNHKQQQQQQQQQQHTTTHNNNSK